MWVYTVLLVTIYSSADSFPSGAPEGTCWSMYPEHSDALTQFGPCPFFLSVSPNIYKPGDEITCGIQQTFKGFLVGAHRQTSNTEEIVGQFVSFPANEVKVITCFGGYRNMITHTNNYQVNNVSVTWKAPTENVGNITFRATVVQSYDTFWYNVEVALFTYNSTVIPSTYQNLSTVPMTDDIDFSLCGITKGCFLYPRHCTGSDCIAAVTYQYHLVTDNFLIEMLSTSAKNYIALGFSKDKQMGHDETYTCISSFSGMSVQHGYNPGHYNERLFTMYVSNMEIRNADGILQCRFIIPGVSFVQKVNQNFTSLTYNTVTFNHEEKWYLQLAWGNTAPGTDVIRFHQNLPAQTYEMVDLKKVDIHRGSTYHWCVRAHAAVMIIAWIFLAGIAPIVPRYYKDWQPKSKFCGTKVWFQLHRGLALIIVLLTASGLAFIFGYNGPQIRERSSPHAYLGLTLTAALVVQVTAGLFRPNPDHKMRGIFNGVHYMLGLCMHILSVATMFFAFKIKNMTQEMEKYGITSVEIWLVILYLWYTGFEMATLYRNAKRKSTSNPEERMLIDKENDGSMSRTWSIMLAAFIFSMAILCINAMLAFFLNN